MDNFIINKKDAFENLLSKKHYFQTLLQVLHSNNLLNIRDIESIQLQVLDILKETVDYYTRNKSSSVRVEIAEQIMLSICYTLGLFLKNQSTIEESITLIKKKEVMYLFSQGEKILKAKVDKCQRLYQIVKETRLQTENYAYIDTIDYGIPLFFKEYDIRFARHETPGSIDYPLAIDERDLVGIEYIEDYLNKIILENKFCSYFDGSEIEALLKGFNKDSKHMLINIFQLVLVNYLGCILIGKEGRSLEITKGDRTYLKGIMENLSQAEFRRLIFGVTEKLCQELFIKDKNLTEYINRTVCKIAPEIKRHIETNTLENIFITLSKSEENLLKYEDGKSLDDSRFRNITEEIRNCSRVEDKIEIIREEFHSLRDLMDVFSSDCIFDDEFIDIFKALEDFEVALLIKSISNDKVLDIDYGTESEKEWHEKFNKYLESLDDTKKREIIRISQEISM
ncbi:DUF6179 domain-containing protein [Clostridium sp. OS1-26]|uniref:DUF6179 domain-containing protein n=1 Tax=Clostridium sp. OS1-26 TaxID=3070681 RepID=UPI0027E18209|nr:DUF6179 domain-containing protein [Clostridium sp. OS1-26]WML32798.1 DUF6179 domain-containing protein [Clostridium sp. OS1-26]